MKFPLLLLLLLSSACNPQAQKAPGCDPSFETCLFGISQMGIEAEEGILPNEALNFEVNVKLVNFNSAQEEKIQQAIELIKKVVASEEFKDAIENHTFEGNKIFVDNGGLANLQIYYRFLLGAEKLSPASNNAIDAEIELYTEESTTVGYTNPTTQRIWMNTKFFNSYTPAQVAGNLTHEWLHKLGFGHALSNSSSRPYSVPYAIGYIMTNLANDL